MHVRFSARHVSHRDIQSVFEAAFCVNDGGNQIDGRCRACQERVFIRDDVFQTDRDVGFTFDLNVFFQRQVLQDAGACLVGELPAA